MTTPTTTENPPPLPNQVRRYRKAAALLRKWMAEKDGYDERIWPTLADELKQGSMGFTDTNESSG